MPSALNRTVILLGLVSFFTDIASEMLYPVLPLYLAQIGFSVAGMGLLEGLAQAMAGLSKGYFGQWSDARLRRVPFVQAGYLLSALAKPLMALWAYPLWVLLMRTTDRLGKGIRSGARDALLAAAATPATRGQVFGFHRGMDSLGAALGPALALAYLWVFPGAYRTLFFLALLPGLLSVAATLWLREPDARPPVARRPGLWASLSYLPRSQPGYRRLLAGLLAFALINSSDLFLLLYLKEQGLSDPALIGLYIFYNLVYALAAWPAGIFSDRHGPKKAFLLGLACFILVYAGLPLASDTRLFVLLFLVYGLYAALTEGVAKAWITHLCPPEETATATGTYAGLTSVAALGASAGAGLVWHYLGPAMLFGVTAALSLLIGLYLSRLPSPRHPAATS